MKKIIFGIFAHPDDETFGPSATLIKEIDEGAALHLILVTDGQAGTNSAHLPDLGATRLQEWQQAANMIGAASTHALHYQDGELCHKLYVEIGAKIRSIVVDELARTNEPAELSFVTFDQNGITGHLDHIAVSYITTQLFCTIKDDLPTHIRLNELAYFCLSIEQAPNRQWSNYYMPIGCDSVYINRTVEVRELLPRKYAAMECHATQKHDADTLRALGDDLLAKDHFHVVTV